MPAKNSKSPPAFRHRRLASPRSIRLLALLPSLEVQATLEVALTEASLDGISADENSYEALSYVWGSRSGTEPIRCDHKLLLVTPNCESALRHLRQKNTNRVLWIDAICIDQENSASSVKERNAQVALMGEIYGKAARTLCWFGQGNGFTDELMELLKGIGTCPSQRGLRKFLLFDEKLRKEGRLDPDSSALNHIFTHPWHSRIWTVQEAAYSQDCQIVCGKSTVPWDVYSAAARLLVYEESIDQIDPKAYKSYVGIDMRNVIGDCLREIPSTNTTPEGIEDERDRRVVFLSSCLSDVNQLQATEPRDKIYGLHALYTDLGISLPEVDYEKPISRVFEEAAVAMIAWSGTLKVLGNACHSHRNPSFPSWVPDWSDGNTKVSTPSGDATGGSKIIELSKNLNPLSGELHVRGKVVGTVVSWRKNTSVAAVFPTNPEQCDIPILTGRLDGLVEDFETLRLWVEKTRFFRRLYSLLRTDGDICQGDPEDMLLDLLNQNSYSEPHEIFMTWLDILDYPETKYDLRHGEILVEKWKTDDESTAPHWTTELTSCAVIMASLLSDSVQLDGRVVDHTSGILDLISQISWNLGDKTLMLAHVNFLGRNALGTSFHSVTAGDSIVLLEGADWPAVLRQTGRKWRFIGPAFVTGIMDGEAWSDESGRVHGMRDFVLV